ncbi:ribosome biogenesis GTPase Der [Candidatus Parcubacteria bacterium]|nr:ribosome biogenesis GTPase Der [Patescibacteria group bacterium]MCG2694127.1 ribosome biogenesis GTPase Der [Candidatus Parcubacteria bacterium]
MPDIKIKKLPVVAIIGRTNVGKSTLFNRIIEQSKALMSATPGTTRDIVYGTPVWRGKTFALVDTAGLDIEGKDELEQNIIRQIERAKSEAEVILLTLDLEAGIMPDDRRLINELMAQDKPFIVVANKGDNKKMRSEMDSKEWQNLPIKNFSVVSAKNGSGIGDLLDEIYKKLKKLKVRLAPIKKEEEIKVSIIGKPNVGKSSLLNKLLSKEVAVVSSIPHTTREPQDIHLEYKGENITLIDTAGIRKKARVERGFEKMGVRKSITMLKRSDIILLVLDVSEPFGSQDKHLASLIEESNKGLIIIANKIDLIKEEDWHSEYSLKIKKYFPFLAWAPVVFTSAETGEKVGRIYDVILEVKNNREKIIDTKRLEKFIKETARAHKPLKAMGVHHPYIFGIKQSGTKPPRFTIFIKEKTSLHDSYLKFLSKKIREEFGFEGVPIKMEVKNVKV